MIKQSIALSLSLGLLAAGSAAADEPKIVRSPLHVAALHEFGQLGEGLFKVGTQGNAEVLELEWIDHFGAFMTQQAVVNDRLHLSAGLGGVFEFRKPERIQSDFYGTQRGEFYIGPTQADAVYHVGDLESPWLKVGTGMWMHKYNPDAINLGEYLFRSLPYPTVTSTGGYVLVNSAAANVEGFKAQLDLGSFKGEALFITETGLAPLYDWSLAFLATYTVMDGLFEVGAGVNFKRLIQPNPSRTARELKQNGYFTIGSTFTFEGKEYLAGDYVTGVDYYTRNAEWYKTRGDTVTANRFEARKAVVDSMAVFQARRDTGELTVPAPPDTSYYTAAGTLLMGRFSFDPKKLMGATSMGPQDLKIYGEVAVLGVKNYPVFYQKISERMPVMLGFNVPTFGILDLFAIQMEWMKNPWLNNTAQVGKRGINIPHFPITSDSLLSDGAYNDMATKDDFKWSINVQKRIGGNITFTTQVASDHMKLVSSRYFYGPQFDHNEVTTEGGWEKIKSGPMSFMYKPRHWYWMMQLGWGI